MELLVLKKKLHWIKAGYVLFKELNLARKTVSNCILDLVIVRYMWKNIDNFDDSAKNKT
jgi:hypothetical protein